MEITEETQTAVALGELATQLRRHYYHLPYETAPDDLLEAGLVVNLDWDERDSLWVQIDTAITIDASSLGSPLTIYAEQGPVVTLWRSPAGSTWHADWDVDLLDSERKRFLRKLSEMATRIATGVDAVIRDYQTTAIDLEEDDRIETTDVAREWLSSS